MALPMYVIFNGKAGHAQGAERWLSTLGHGCEIHQTASPDDTRRHAQLALERGDRRIIVAGGDGTIGLVVEGIAPYFEQVELGIVPLGTGNDFARSAGIPLDRPHAAFELAVQGPAIPVDLIRVTNGHRWYVINAASGGFGGQVAADVSHLDKKRWGSFAYWLTAVADLVDVHETDVCIEIDGRAFEERIYGLVVANGMYLGGGFPIARGARLNDGLFDLTIIPALPTLELLAEGLNFMLGVSNTNARLKTIRASRASVSASPYLPFSIDGEPTKEVDASFEIMPAALRVVIGPSAPAAADGITAEVGESMDGQLGASFLTNG